MLIRNLVAAVAVLAIGAAVFSFSSRPAEAQGDVAVGTSGYDFSLMDTQGNTHSLSEYLADGKTVVLEWFNPGCPVVVKYYEGGNSSMVDAKAFAAENDVVWLAVNSGAPGKQGHGLETNIEAAQEWGIENPILLDENGTVGRMFHAQNTPQLFILSSDGVLIYNGGVDETRTAQDTPQNNYVINALTQHMAGEEVNPATTPHPGCNVKYGDPPAPAPAAGEPSVDVAR